MILVIGGLGFVGANTAEALLNLGEDCVIVWHENAAIPRFLQDHVGTRVFVERADVMNLDSVLAVGRKYPLTGIVNLVTGGVPAVTAPDPLQLAMGVHGTITAVAHSVKVAMEAGARRVTLASAPVVYTGVAGQPWREDQPLPPSATHHMEAAKKCSELVSSYLASLTGVECVQLRLGAMYGPAYDPARSNLVGRLVHAAVNRRPPDLEGMRFASAHVDDASDLCYIKDAARGIALLQTADALPHRVYNVAAGRATTNQQIADAVSAVVPECEIALPPGHAANAPLHSWRLDISRIHEDTGYQPAFDIEAGVAHYVAWLRQGNDR